MIPWWSQNTFGRHIYIGQADYKMNMAGWTDANPNNQIAKQIAINRSPSNIGGQVHFRQAFLVSNPLGYRSELMANQYKRAALLPRMAWKDPAVAGAPAAPAAPIATRLSASTVGLSWSAAPAGSTEYDKARRYAIYRAEVAAINTEDPTALVGLTNAGETSFTDTGAVAGKHYFYAVTALNRLHAESPRSPLVSDDTVPPTVRTRPVSRTLAGGVATVSPADVDDGSSDNWGIASLSLNRTRFACADIGSQSLLLSATDKAGNTASAAAQLQVLGALPRPGIQITNSSTVVTGYRPIP